MTRIIIFDFDGTIADTLLTIKNILQNLSTKYGYKQLSDEESNKMRDYTVQEIFKKQNIAFYKLPLLVYDVKKALNNKIAHIKPIKGIQKVLHTLKKENYKLALLTSNDKNNVEIFLKHNKLDFFDFIYTGTTIFGKANVIKGFLKKNNINSNNVVYIGDEVRDIEATKKVGIPIIAGTWGFNSRKALEQLKPEFLIDNPKEILATLKSI